jgi:hypothetical protein
MSSSSLVAVPTRQVWTGFFLNSLKASLRYWNDKLAATFGATVISLIYPGYPGEGYKDSADTVTGVCWIIF